MPRNRAKRSKPSEKLLGQILEMLDWLSHPPKDQRLAPTPSFERDRISRKELRHLLTIKTNVPPLLQTLNSLVRCGALEDCSRDELRVLLALYVNAGNETCETWISGETMMSYFGGASAESSINRGKAGLKEKQIIRSAEYEGGEEDRWSKAYPVHQTKVFKIVVPLWLLGGKWVSGRSKFQPKKYVPILHPTIPKPAPKPRRQRKPKAVTDDSPSIPRASPAEERRRLLRANAAPKIAATKQRVAQHLAQHRAQQQSVDSARSQSSEGSSSV